jgi:aspartate/methionine/tyrosine aminotransferase
MHAAPFSARPAWRLAAVQQPVIPRMGELIAEHPGTLSLGQGMVHWSPPEQARERLQACLASADPLQAYGPMAGDLPLRDALCRWLQSAHQLDLSDSALLITAGSNMAFNAVAQVLCDPGDELILPVPYYFNHAMAIQLAGGQAVAVDAGLIPDPERLAAAITPRTRAIVTVSPNNPSGAVIPPATLAAINALCASRGLLHLCDEAYALFGHGDTPVWSPGSRAGSGGHTVSFGSLSKSHGMAGWRLGWAVVPPALMAALAKVQDTILICPPRPIQQAAIGALEAGVDWVRERVAGLAERRRLVLSQLQVADAPWRVLGPADGAFYALLQLESPLSSDAAMERLIREHGVALVSGSSFGLGGCYLRLSYGLLNDANLEEALRRLRHGLEQMCSG